MADRFDKFTEHARRVLTLAQEEAQRLNHNYIGTEHLLLGLMRETDGVAAMALTELGIDLAGLRSAVDLIIGQGEQAVFGEIGLTPRAKKVIELAVDEARRLSHHYIGTEHLLLGLVREGDGIAATILKDRELTAERVRTTVQRILGEHGPEDVSVSSGGAARAAGSGRFDQFTERARRVLTLAQEEAQRFNHDYIGTEHLLLALVHEGDGIAAKVLANLGVELAKLRSAVEFVIGRGDRAVLGEIGLTPRAKKVMELAVDEARWLSHHYIGTEHLLIGLVREGEGIAAGVLESLGVNLQRVRRETERLLSTNLPQGTSGTAGPALRRSEGRAGGELARLLAELERVRREKDTAISRQEYETATRLRDHEVELEGRIERLERIAEATRRASEARTRPEAGSGGGEPWSLQQHAAFREGFALGLAFTGEARKVLESALAEATRLGAASIRTEHLILALLLPEGPLVRELKKHGVDIERVRAAMREPGGEHRPPEDQESG